MIATAKVQAYDMADFLRDAMSDVAERRTDVINNSKTRATVRVVRTDVMQNKQNTDEYSYDIVDDLRFDHVSSVAINILDESSSGQKLPSAPKMRRTQADIDKEIVDKFYKNPTQKNFAWIWHRFYHGLSIYAQSMMKDIDEAADIVQDTFMRAWERRNEYRPDVSKYSTWLYAICRNFCVSEKRHQTASRTADHDAGGTVIHDRTYSDYVGNAGWNDTFLTDLSGDVRLATNDDVIHCIYDAMLREVGKMDPLFQQVMDMKDFNDMQISEISAALGVKETKLKNLYYRSKDALGVRLKRKYPELYESYRQAIYDKHNADISIDVYITRPTDPDEAADIYCY